MFELIALNTINNASLRLVTFASQGMAETFVRSFQMSDDERIAFAVKASQKQALRNALCKVAGISRNVKREKGESYVIQKGKRKGQKATALATQYESYTASDYADAIQKLNLALLNDPTWNDPTSGKDKRVALVLTKVATS